MPLNFFAAVGPSQLVFGNGIVFGTSLEHLLTLLALYDISTPVLPKASTVINLHSCTPGKREYSYIWRTVGHRTKLTRALINLKHHSPLMLC